MHWTYRLQKEELPLSVTLRDVAQKAGVSPVVVSRVLHNKALSIRVSEATAERVRQAADDLGYRVNVFARNFRERRSYMIGVLHGVGFPRLHFSGGSRYFAALCDGIVDGAFRHGYSVTFCPKLFGASPEDAMSDGRFDGLVWYSSAPSEENRDMLRRCSVPLVVIHSKSEEFNDKHPTVICDNSQGIQLAVDHLIGLGHSKIGFAMEGDDRFSESLLRYNAFCSIMADRGLPIRDGDIVDVSKSDQSIAAYFKERRGHTAIVAHNEGLAAEFLSKAQSNGLSVPDDMSIVGFDSTDFCNELRPSLTAISQPLVQMGERAIDALMKVIADEAPNPLETVFPCSLDIRESTGRAPI